MLTERIELYDKLVLAKIRSDDSRVAGQCSQLSGWFGNWLQHHCIVSTQKGFLHGEKRYVENTFGIGTILEQYL
jgi:hypothetical protein